MRLQIERGRVVEFKSSEMSKVLGVIIDFVTQTSFVIQLVCAATGKAMGREVMSQKNLVLMPAVIDFDDSETVRSEHFVKSIEEKIKEMVAAKQSSEGYREAVRKEKLMEMTDFERFLSETEQKIRENILKGKGF